MQEMNIDGEIKENWDNLVKMLTRNVFSSSVNMTTSNKFEFNDLSAIFSKSTISAISTYISEDIDAIMMYTKSLFSYFRGNATLAFNITYALLEFLVESGSTFFNWIISFSIFMTTLFYVILSERNILTDMEWNNSILQSYICRHLQKSIHVAIRSVFIVSFKMASFYGLYTWLTHSIFDLTFVFLPAVIASILAVIPIVGSYWAVIPGVIQLLFIHENGFYLSIALIMLHLLPMYIIDSSIYSEIKIIHPYLTGLAIIGGVYSFGFEGSVIGPLLLVIMIVIIDVYKKLMSNDSNPYKSYTRNASFG
ncbi:hypothetical protein A3Q56_03585 [Intoshia linei]|uniref:AI-2E family transporter n=1 Tax=Intoshia linei TaxID=1819745 RepID=A0A177B4L0_9BILA|nr:hypothetical protein A3Q56_03585 [Intoshia linei]